MIAAETVLYASHQVAMARAARPRVAERRGGAWRCGDRGGARSWQKTVVVAKGRRRWRWNGRWDAVERRAACRAAVKGTSGAHGMAPVRWFVERKLFLNCWERRPRPGGRRKGPPRVVAALGIGTGGVGGDARGPPGVQVLGGGAEWWLRRGSPLAGARRTRCGFAVSRERDVVGCYIICGWGAARVAVGFKPEWAGTAAAVVLRVFCAELRLKFVNLPALDRVEFVDEVLDVERHWVVREPWLVSGAIGGYGGGRRRGGGVAAASGALAGGFLGEELGGLALDLAAVLGSERSKEFGNGDGHQFTLSWGVVRGVWRTGGRLCGRGRGRIGAGWRRTCPRRRGGWRCVGDRTQMQGASCRQPRGNEAPSCSGSVSL